MLHISLYMLIPVLPWYITEMYDVSLTYAGALFALYGVSLLIIGPFYAYLIDTYKRKSVYLFAALALALFTGGYLLTGSLVWIVLLRVLQGGVWGITGSLGSTLSIDITNSALRTQANVLFNRSSYFGMMFGLILGLLFYKLDGALVSFYVSMGFGIFALLLASGVYVIFRAPIGVSLCSIDRFLLLHGIIPAFNLAIVSFAFVVSLVIMNAMTIANFYLLNTTLLLLVVLVIGLAFSALIYKHTIKNNALRTGISIGFILLICALLLVHIDSSTEIYLAAGFLLGIGIGLISSGFLVTHVQLSKHCQRATAVMTSFLGWEIGVAGGVAFGCYYMENVTDIQPESLIAILFLAAFFFYLGITYPYFKKYKAR